MSKPLNIILILVLILSLCACKTSDSHSSSLPKMDSSTTCSTTAVPTTQPIETTLPKIPSEPTPPEKLISEERTDGLVYIPSFNEAWLNSSIQMWFNLAEDCYPDMTITYDITTSIEINETFLMQGSGAYEFTPLENGRVLRIYGWLRDETYQKMLDSGGSMFIEAFIRADGYIVGYGIFEIGTDGECYAVMRSETVIFPMIDGRLQYCTEEYAAEKLADMEQTITPFDKDAKQKEEEEYWTAYWENQNNANSTDPTQTE